MNSGKLFNFKYLKQNIKKSKGLLIVLMFLIPVITSLILIGNNSTEYVSSTEQITVSIANILGMYGIPFILSFILYGYVFKKNSVDFIGSMPISRTTIFVTNYLGGIILIAIIQIITALVTFLGASFLSNIFIAPQMILDIFIVMFLSYIFVFSAASLAMTVSGNVLIQIVVTLLILFLIPFTLTFGFSQVNKTLEIKLLNHDVAINNFTTTEYTMPSIFFTEVFGGNSHFYSTSRNVKTLLLSIVYFAIGVYLFNKRKMENVEVSFSKIWVHLLVKGITLLPMVFIIELLDMEIVFKGIAITLVFIYYCLYDFITNRKVSIKFTIPCFIVSFVILVGLYHGMIFIGEKIYQTSISVDDIQAISIETDNNIISSSLVNNSMKSNSGNYVTDKETIKKICEGLVDIKTRNYDGYYYSGFSPFVYLNFKLNNGRIITTSTQINYSVYKQVIDDIFESQEYLEKEKEKFKLGNDTYIIANGKFLSPEETKVIVDLYNNLDIKNILEIEREFSYQGEYQRNYIPQPDFTAYCYKNHELCRIEINPFLSQELFDKMSEISWNRLKDILEKYDSEEEKYIDAYVSEIRVSTYSVQDDNKYYHSFENTTGIINYAREHMNEKIDMNDCFYVISINSVYPLQTSIYLKETEELKSIIERDTYKDDDYYYPYVKDNEDTVEIYE